jgi:hypothetical protein
LRYRNQIIERVCFLRFRTKSVLILVLNFSSEVL